MSGLRKKSPCPKNGGLKSCALHYRKHVGGTEGISRGEFQPPKFWGNEWWPCDIRRELNFLKRGKKIGEGLGKREKEHSPKVKTLTLTL